MRTIFDLYLSGRGKTNIARYLNNLGVLSPSVYKVQQGITQGKNASPLWQEGVITQILKNPVYVGDLVYGKRPSIDYKSKKQKAVPSDEWIIVGGTHEAIIPREDFEAVQAMFEGRSHSSRGGTKHPLAGMVYCADCGKSLQKTSNRRVSDDKGYAYLQCRSHILTRNDSCCTRHSTRLDRLLAKVEQEVREHIQKFYEMCELEKLTSKRGASEKKRLTKGGVCA